MARLSLETQRFTSHTFEIRSTRQQAPSFHQLHYELHQILRVVMDSQPGFTVVLSGQIISAEVRM